jgi:hypothetical protein
MSDVLPSAVFSVGDLPTRKFNEAVVRHIGISLLAGVLCLTDQKLIFYTDRVHDFFSLPCATIKLVRPLRLLHRDVGVWLEDTARNVAVFGFESPVVRDSVLSIIAAAGVRTDPGLDAAKLTRHTQRWVEGELSTFDYLVKLNLMSGRAWCDSSQFPLFPWVFRDFTEQTPNRDLRLPLFAQTPEDQALCVSYFEETCELQGAGAHFPTYMSNIGSAIFYLVRIEPFTTREMEFQGGELDSGDRTFVSMEATVKLMSSPLSKATFECVPEFYYLPEFFANMNAVAFPRPSSGPPVDSVALPRWAPTPEDFVFKLRRALESPTVSQHLHEWLDLIWGVRRTGPGAAERFFALPELTFSFRRELFTGDPMLLRAITDQMHTCGTAPARLFADFHEPRRALRPFGASQLRLECHRPATLQERQTLRFEFTNERWNRLASRLKVRINGDRLELSGGCGLIRRAFRPEIQPILIYTSGARDVITAHALPFVTHWVAGPEGLSHAATLKGHLAAISSLFLNISSKIVLAGHADGIVSAWALDPVRFLREIACDGAWPVVLVRAGRASPDILTCQEIDGGTEVSLFSVNGKKLARAEIPGRVRDCVVTSFPIGTRRNVWIVLMAEGTLVVLDARKLKMRATIALDFPGAAALALFKDKRRGDKTLVVTHVSGDVTLYGLDVQST